MNDVTHGRPFTDVCVVGTGPAGMAAALTLGSAGRTVLLVESGGFDPSPRNQELNDADHSGFAYEGLGQTRHRQVGGTANIWNVSIEQGPAAKYVPLDPRDLADWPMCWSELEPYYREAQTLCGLGPFEYGSDYWATPERRPFRLRGTGLCSGVYQFGPAEVFTHVLVDRLRSTETITLVPSTTVVGLVTDDRGRRVLGVRARDGNGQALEVKARSVVLACGAVENARLLMLSGTSGSKWLGRCFMEHARDFSLVLVPDSPELFADASFYDLQASGDVRVGGRLSLTDQAVDAYRLPNASMTLTPRARSPIDRGGLLGRLGRMFRPAGSLAGEGWQGRYGWSKVRAPGQAFDAFRIILNLEQRPNPSNRIELSSRTDRFGQPLPRLILDWTADEQARLNELRRLLGEWFRSAHLGRLIVDPDARPDLNAHHHAGTTRMGLNQEDGVVDAQGQVFGVENLYVAGASVFPSAGFANPTLTIVAMAIRLARRVGGALA